MATRVGTRKPGDSAFAEFTAGVRARARGKTRREVVVETVTQQVPVQVPAAVAVPVASGAVLEKPSTGPDDAPASVPETAPALAPVSAPPADRVFERSAALKPTASQLRGWARTAAVALLACLLWAAFSASPDTLVAGIGTTLAIFALPALLWVVARGVYCTGMWLVSRVEVAPAQAEPPQAPKQASVACPAPLTVTRMETREVQKKVGKEVPMDPQWAAERALTAVKAGGYSACEAVPGLPLPHSVVRHGVGAEAELHIGTMLENRLGTDWQVSHDLDVYGRGHRAAKKDVSANIDHLISGPAGLVMIDTKAWTGRLVVRSSKKGKRLANAEGSPRSSQIRGDSPTTLLYEAGAVDYGTGECQVGLVVIAVSSGKVGEKGGSGVLEVPAPPQDRDNPRIPIVAVESSKLISYLENLPPVRSTPWKIDEIVAFSDRLGW